MTVFQLMPLTLLLNLCGSPPAALPSFGLAKFSKQHAAHTNEHPRLARASFTLSAYRRTWADTGNIHPNPLGEHKQRKAAVFAALVKVPGLPWRNVQARWGSGLLGTEGVRPDLTFVQMQSWQRGSHKLTRTEPVRLSKALGPTNCSDTGWISYCVLAIRNLRNSSHHTSHTEGR